MTTEKIQASTGESSTSERVIERSEPNPVAAKTVSGMKKKSWAGKDMWECSSCGSTFFDEVESRSHSCHQPISTGIKLKD